MALRAGQRRLRLRDRRNWRARDQLLDRERGAQLDVGVALAKAPLVVLELLRLQLEVALPLEERHLVRLAMQFGLAELQRVRRVAGGRRGALMRRWLGHAAEAPQLRRPDRLVADRRVRRTLRW
ncbi:MAG: hypothetical protein OTI36_20980 [Beijerinckiaceae bacterium]|nr:hypothetical protein [Beijerinckiaceae bacterium]